MIDAPETSDAWWVVDGQQRITALTACLAHPLPLPEQPSRQDPYALYFDAGEQRFEPPPTTGKVPSTWVPLPYLLDASQLTEWVFAWEHGADAELRRRGIQAVVEGEEESVQRLLGLVRKERPRHLELPAELDARADVTRIALLALAHRGPRDLRQGGRIDVAGLLETEGKGAFAEILRSKVRQGHSPANRIFQAKGTPVRRLVEQRISVLVRWRPGGFPCETSRKPHRGDALFQ